MALVSQLVLAPANQLPSSTLVFKPQVCTDHIMPLVAFQILTSHDHELALVPLCPCLSFRSPLTPF